MTQCLDDTQVAAHTMKALGIVHGCVVQSEVPKTLIDLVCLRATQINGCAYSIDKHARDLLKDGMSVEKLVLVPG